jgi:hypothetical protein
LSIYWECGVTPSFCHKVRKTYFSYADYPYCAFHLTTITQKTLFLKSFRNVEILVQNDKLHTYLGISKQGPKKAFSGKNFFVFYDFFIFQKQHRYALFQLISFCALKYFGKILP